MYQSFYNWWRDSGSTEFPPFGTPRTTIWVGPLDMVQVSVMMDVKMENSEDGVLVYSGVETPTHYLTPMDVNGTTFRMAYAPEVDVVYASQSTYVVRTELSGDGPEGTINE